MRLKSLTIKGFKSFADETIVNFSEDLIGIVGPNGSGKSNIVDSIRWVLGEQKTSELRLESMSDVIFNGTKSRKEGRVARVTLTFDNTQRILPVEFSEVSISRILYRDGGSEYRLNNVSCRKKDITNLFIDSGIGSNSYAIISLNMVEDILHDTSGSRRLMIEQAAGISKYKIRKKETLSKLRSTEEDLNRVGDLLHEIEQNMSLYERQAKRTERFNKLKEDYKDLSIHIAIYQTLRYQQQLIDLSEKLTKEKSNHGDLTAHIRLKEAELEKLKKDILVYEKSLSEDQKNYNKVNERLNVLENKKNLSVQKNTDAQNRISTLMSRQDGYLERRKLAESKKNDQSEQLTKSGSVLTKLQKEYDEKDQIFNNASERYEQLRQKERLLKEEEHKRSSIRQNAERAIQRIETRLQLSETSIEDQKKRHEKLVADLKSNQLAFDQSEKDYNEVFAKQQDSIKKFELLKGQTQLIIEQKNAATTDINREEKENASLQQRIDFTKELLEKREGLSKGAKAILDSNQFNSNLFSDLFEVKAKNHTAIVELLLKEVMNYLVVDTRAEALEIINHLKQNQLGRIGIFVLDEIHSVESSRSASNSLIKLADAISSDEKYERLKNYATDGIYITNDRYVNQAHTKDGIIGYANDTLISYQGKVFGGSTDLFEGMHLGRKQMLDNLIKQLLKSTKKLESLRGDLDSVDSKFRISQAKEQEIQSAIKTLSREVETLKYSKFQYENKLNSAINSLNELKERTSLIESEKAQLQTNLKSEQENLKSIIEVQSAELSDEKLSTEIESSFKFFNSSRVEKEFARTKLFDHKTSHGLLEKELHYQSEQIENLNKEEKYNQHQINELQVTVELTAKDIEKSKRELLDLYSERDAVKQKMSEYEDSYFKEKGKIFEIEKEITETRHKMQLTDQVIAQLTEKKTNASFESTAIADRTKIEFQVELKDQPAEAISDYDQFDIGASKEKQGKLMNRISTFGDINPMAITAYNEIKSRHDQITKEKDDIEAAKNSLEETIAEIEESASTKFTASLELIKTNFQKVFQSLFSEDDSCDIVLLDSEHPLEARIEIIARPKGKKPKSINLLSGGEKTLTAASFLFALYLMKPAPFCIFDEVDAPLDDVNVQKFNKLIREFSKESQFIVITHNKLTMSEVDVLYGVFLREVGVSGLSAVDFRSYKEAEVLETQS